MTKKRNLTEKWTEFAEKRLLGKTIIAVEYLTDKEIQDIGWYQRPVAIILNDG